MISRKDGREHIKCHFHGHLVDKTDEMELKCLTKIGSKVSKRPFNEISKVG